MNKQNRAVSLAVKITAAAVTAAVLIVCAVKMLPANNRSSGLLPIIYVGSSSAGSEAKYTLSDNSVLIEYSEVRSLHFPSVRLDFGWYFKPVKPGSCTLISEVWEYGEFSRAEIYDVTVSDDFDVSFIKRDAEKLYPFRNYVGGGNSVSREKDGGMLTLSPDKADSFFGEVLGLYGFNSDCEKPYTDGMTKITADYFMDGERQSVMYIGGGKIYYTYADDGGERWAAFTPDEYCSLDGIIGLI